MAAYFALAERVAIAVLMVSGLYFAAPGAALAGNIYDSQVLQRMKFSPGQRPKVARVLRQSDREMAAIFRKYRINPNAKPNYDKLQRASRELQALESREKRKMKHILTPKQFRIYLGLLRETSARVIKKTRKRP